MKKQSAYAASGVDIDAGEQFVRLIKERIKTAWPNEDDDIGGFAGTFYLPKRQRKGKAGTDGSGSMIIIAAMTGRFKVPGKNAAAMSLVDNYAEGALPVAMLDVLDAAKLLPLEHIEVIDGLIEGCIDAGPQCRLIGGETAELPDLFAQPWMINVNTTVIGAPQPGIITGNIAAGQAVVGWPSYGAGSNGFSLLRDVFGLRDGRMLALKRLNREWEALGGRLVDSLLRPAPIWIKHAEQERHAGVKFVGHAHITGGGLVDNIPRILPPHLKVVLDRSTWERPPLFALTQREGKVSPREMDRVFNQGIMMASIIDHTGKEFQNHMARSIGTVERRKEGEPQVQFINKFAD